MTDELKAFELEYRTATGKQVSEDTPQPFIDWLVDELEKARATRSPLPLTEEEKEVLAKQIPLIIEAVSTAAFYNEVEDPRIFYLNITTLQSFLEVRLQTEGHF